MLLNQEKIMRNYEQILRKFRCQSVSLCWQVEERQEVRSTQAEFSVVAQGQSKDTIQDNGDKGVREHFYFIILVIKYQNGS